MGSEGFVGNNLVQELSSKNDVFCADIFDNSNHQHYQQCDVTNFDNVLNVVNDVDVVIDLVAHSLVSSIDGPITNAKINIMGLLNILESCRKNDVKKIIFTSASSMIGIPQTSNVSETHPASPQTAYGITKLTSEHYLRLYQEMYGLNYTVFRFFNIYGPHQKNGLIPTLYYRIKNNEPLTVFGKGDQIRDYVFIQDVIPFFQKNGGGSIVNISSTYGILSPDQSLYQIFNKKSPSKKKKLDVTIEKPIGYSVSKSGVLNLTRFLATRFAVNNIRVNTLTLGGVYDNNPDEFVKLYSKKTPMGRMANKNEYVGPLLFLVSDMSSYMTGSNLIVDGGWSAW